MVYIGPDVGRVFVQLASLLGIGLLSAAAAVINHVVDSEIDSKMARTRHRPVAKGRLSKQHAFALLDYRHLGFVMAWANTLHHSYFVCACRLCLYLHLIFKACHTAKYCYWWFGRCYAAVARWVSETGHMAAPLAVSDDYIY